MNVKELGPEWRAGEARAGATGLLRRVGTAGRQGGRVRQDVVELVRRGRVAEPAQAVRTVAQGLEARAAAAAQGQHRTVVVDGLAVGRPQLGRVRAGAAGRPGRSVTVTSALRGRRRRATLMPALRRRRAGCWTPPPSDRRGARRRACRRSAAQRAPNSTSPARLRLGAGQPGGEVVQRDLLVHRVGDDVLVEEAGGLLAAARGGGAPGRSGRSGSTTVISNAARWPTSAPRHRRCRPNSEIRLLPSRVTPGTRSR